MVETEKGACKWFLVSNGLINKLVYSGAKEFQVGVVLVTGVVLATFHLVNFPKSCFLRRYIDNMVFTYYKKKKKIYWHCYKEMLVGLSRLFNYFDYFIFNPDEFTSFQLFHFHYDKCWTTFKLCLYTDCNIITFPQTNE